MIAVQAIAAYLEAQAPLSYQAPYDNAGLQLGDPAQQVSKALVTLDVTLPVLQEATARGCQLVIAHHPLLFAPLKRLVAGDPLAACVTYALRRGLALYVAHTNLDHVPHGLNGHLARRLGLEGLHLLSPLAEDTLHLTVWLPADTLAVVREALLEAGAHLLGTPDEVASLPLTPLTLAVLPHRKQAMMEVLQQACPHRHIAHVWQPATTTHTAGAGMVGTLPAPLSPPAFLDYLKECLDLTLIRYAPTHPARNIQRVALCGGAGSDLWQAARHAAADALVTADIKYHQFMAPQQSLMLLDIGHYESEVGVQDLLCGWLSQKFTNIAFLKATASTNPVHYHT